MKLDLGKVLEGTGEADVVTANVDLTSAEFYGRHPFQTPIKVTAKAKNHVGVVTLDCTYDFTLCVNCDRCLAPLELPVSRTVTHTVVRSLSNEEEDTDLLVAEDGTVELDELATNDILPELPSRFLCDESCKGICPICGANRNRKDCGCKAKVDDPRLEALKQLLQNHNNTDQEEE